ncbi:MAG: DUF393 domain-containing protein [Vicinamibacterales bacterium]|nr:DUF393 domain-containing protein [Vicinamibacterales bacterium]
MGFDPPSPVLVYDGDCDFCRFWLSRWQSRLGDRLESLPFQDSRVAKRFPHLPADRLKGAVHLVASDGTIRTGAGAVFEIMSLGGRPLPMRAYRHVPGVASLSELGYRFVAANRPFFWKLTTMLFRPGR